MSDDIIPHVGAGKPEAKALYTGDYRVTVPLIPSEQAIDSSWSDLLGLRMTSKRDPSQDRVATPFFVSHHKIEFVVDKVTDIGPMTDLIVSDYLSWTNAEYARTVLVERDRQRESDRVAESDRQQRQDAADDYIAQRYGKDA